MNENSSFLSSSEKLIYRLRALYSTFGYTQYRMSKFEEYDLYSRNKEFLVSDSVITFTDTNGRLMALKPDVTLSIIKNTKDTPESVRRLCYNENVYRVSKGSNSFREIMQVGLECIGAVDEYCIGETLLLAAESLKEISGDYVLAVSDLTLVSAFADAVTDDPLTKRELIRCLGEKNSHELASCCKAGGIGQERAELFRKLLALYGTPEKVLPELKTLAASIGVLPEAKALERTLGIFRGSGAEAHIMLDFSVIGDLNYYNGIVFKGYINGIPESVLSGGSYDGLMRKMGRSDRAIGFAVYMDLAALLEEPAAPYDVDVILIYGGDESPETVAAAVARLKEEGKTVFACRTAGRSVIGRATAELKNGEVRYL